MSDQNAVTAWIEQLRLGDEEASRRVWDTFFHRLLDVASRRLKYAKSADHDEEDVVLSAMKSFCLGVRDGRYPNLNDHDDLWRLLFVITSRKIADRYKFNRRGKRDVRREALGLDELMANPQTSQHFASPEPTPEMICQCEEQLSWLLSRLQHDDLKTVAICKMEGFTNEEIAAKMSRSLATIERKLRTIREIWSQS